MGMRKRAKITPRRRGRVERRGHMWEVVYQANGGKTGRGDVFRCSRQAKNR